MFFFGCSGDSAAPVHGDHAQLDVPDAIDNVTFVGGVQVIEVEAGKMGYEPSEVVVRAGIPARLIFTRTVASSCSEHIQIPDYGIEKTELPLDEPVAFEIAPEVEGSLKFVCGMDMQSGTIVVRG